MINPPKAPLKFVIYGTGMIGQLLTGWIIGKGWTVVAAFNRAGEKIGQDLGRIAGLGQDLGVIIRDTSEADVAMLTELGADVAIIATTNRMSVNFPAYEVMLNAGINVLCHGAESYQPWFTNPDLAAKIDTLAKARGVTFAGGGIWDSTRFWPALIAAGPCIEIERLHHYSLTDTPRQGVGQMLMLGTGSDVASYTEKLAKMQGAVQGTYPQIPATILQKLGYTVTDVVETVEPIVWDEPYFCTPLNRVLEPGIVIGTRVKIDISTREGPTASCEIDLRPFKPGEEEEMGWSVYGKPSFHIRVRREQSSIASASSLFNRIPDILAAEPGISDLYSMGPLKASVFA